MKILCVGDVHTKLWVVEAVEKIAPEYDAVIFVGDYADDWGQGPQATIDIWRAVMNFTGQVYWLIGNHDFAYVNWTSTTYGGYSQLTQMLLNAPENRDIKDWLTGLPIVLTIDGVTYSHAGMTNSWTGDVGDPSSLWDLDDSPIWARPAETLSESGYRDIPQVFGHTPVSTCHEVAPNIWAVDTFSTYPDGQPIGDGTVLEVIDGKQFNVLELTK